MIYKEDFVFGILSTEVFLIYFVTDLKPRRGVMIIDKQVKYANKPQRGEIL